MSEQFDAIDWCVSRRKSSAAVVKGLTVSKLAYDDPYVNMSQNIDSAVEIRHCFPEV